MPFVPCFIGNQPAGFLKTLAVPRSRTYRLATATQEDLCGFRGTVAPPTKIQHIELDVGMRNFHIDRLEFQMARSLELVIDKMMHLGAPIGVSEVDVLRAPTRDSIRLQWACFAVSLEQHEAIFDLPHFHHQEDKSMLIDERLSTGFGQALALAVGGRAA